MDIYNFMNEKMIRAKNGEKTGINFPFFSYPVKGGYFIKIIKRTK